MDDLTAKAERWGIEPGYHDVFGGWHPVPRETLDRLVAALSAGGKPAQPTPAGDHLQAFQGNGRRRLWALAVQLYAVRSRRNWGHGDFTDLARLVALAA
ncbi:MAG TPA: hypothetical protein VK522_05705, partial [Pseudolabrys sp.]|nr:hypothetical protein [Pseudolabrys sp.]